MLARRHVRTASPSAAALAAALLLAAGCSVVPPARYPAFCDHCLAAEFLVPADGRLRVPLSSALLTVNELRFLPSAAGEQFGAAGERWFLFAAGSTVQLQGRFRVYADDHGRLASVAELLPGATRVQRLEAGHLEGP